MAEKQTIVLITGANRGIGYGLTKAYLARPSHTVIAAVRDPAATTANSLKALTPASGSRLVLVKIDSKVETDAAAAIKAAQAAGVGALDIVIANAGIAPPMAKLDSVPLQDLREAVEVNTVAPLALFQATVPLLQAAAAPLFLVVSTALASIGTLEATSGVPVGTYGASKAAVNYLVRRIAFENPWLNAFVMHPGFVQTDMGNSSARSLGLEKAHQTVDESVAGVIKKLDTATIETTSGGFWNWDGTEMQY